MALPLRPRGLLSRQLSRRGRCQPPQAGADLVKARPLGVVPVQAGRQQLPELLWCICGRGQLQVVLYYGLQGGGEACKGRSEG